MERVAAGDERAGRDEGTPLLEWVAGGVGLVLAAGMIGFLGWEAARDAGDRPPEVSVAAQEAVPAGDGFVVPVVAANASPRTAAAVAVEGVLTRDGREVERAEATLDYVPGRSEARGGLFFREDPRVGELAVRALGYEEP